MISDCALLHFIIQNPVWNQDIYICYGAGLYLPYKLHCCCLNVIISTPCIEGFLSSPLIKCPLLNGSQQWKLCTELMLFSLSKKHKTCAVALWPVQFDSDVYTSHVPSIVSCPLPPWLEPPQMLIRNKLPLHICSLRSPSVKADVVQLCLITDSVFAKAIQEGSSLEKTYSPSLDLTRHHLFWRRQLRGLHSESAEN